MPFIKYAVGSIVGLVLALAVTMAHATPENGWWWNPAESGRGFFFEVQGTQVYMAGYFYKDNGQATWMVSQGEMATPTSYQSRLLSFASGQTLVGNYTPPGPFVDEGAVTIIFADDRHATLTWPGGSIALERHVFASGTAPLQPKNGWWWNDAESGRGYSIEVQGDTLFMVGFMYEASGVPVWYLSAGKMTSETYYQGDLLQFAHGQTQGGTYHPPASPAVVGKVTIDFTAPDEAEMTLSDNTPGALGAAQLKKSKIINVKPQFKAPVPVSWPDAWEGTAKDTIHFRVDADGVVIDSLVRITAQITWVDTLLSPLTGGGSIYEPLGTVKLVYTFAFKNSLQNCTGEKIVDVQVTAVDGMLTVNGNGSYSGTLSKTIAYPATVKCVLKTPGGDIPYEYEANNAGDFNIVMKGNVIYLRIQGSPKPLTPGPGTTITQSWQFDAKK